MLMMVPPPFCFIWRKPARQQKKVPRKLVFNTRSKVSVLVLSMRPPPPIPALLTRRSSRPYRWDRRRRAHREHQHRNRSEEHTSELQSLAYLVCRLLLEKKNTKNI